MRPERKAGSTDRDPMASPLIARLVRETGLRRVPQADRRDPNGAPPRRHTPAIPPGGGRGRIHVPLGLLWHRREVHVTGPGMYRLSIPLSGGPPPARASETMNALLHQMWVTYPTSEQTAAVAVTALIGPLDGATAMARHQLILLLTVDPGDPDRRIDGIHMARHLRAALEQLSSAR